MSISQKNAASETCRNAFGALLTSQGRGYYVTLELLAIAWGTLHHDGEVLPAFNEADTVLEYARRSHDFARRWMSGELSHSEHVGGAEGPESLRALLESLRVPIPNRRVLPGWLGQHLYPYVGELIHYDAVSRKGRVLIERYLYRGAGALAHKMLRCDTDPARLEANRNGLRLLVSDAGGSLGSLALACSAHDAARGDDTTDAFKDELEPRANIDTTPWVEHLRQGFSNIVQRDDLARSKKIDLLMVWVPYCIARHQLDRAAQILGEELSVIPMSLTVNRSAVRQLARREFDHSRALIDRALVAEAKRAAKSSTEDADRDIYLRLANTRSWRNPLAAFFSGTMATAGAVNAHVGSRHFTAQLSMLEALVCASLAPGEELEYHRFCSEILAKQFRLLVDPPAGSHFGLMKYLDNADLEANASQLANDLHGLGLLSEYSDATRMVHGEVAR